MTRTTVVLSTKFEARIPVLPGAPDTGTGIGGGN